MLRKVTDELRYWAWLAAWWLSTIPTLGYLPMEEAGPWSREHARKPWRQRYWTRRTARAERRAGTAEEVALLRARVRELRLVAAQFEQGRQDGGLSLVKKKEGTQ